jgi:hypothetical protein
LGDSTWRVGDHAASPGCQMSGRTLPRVSWCSGLYGNICRLAVTILRANSGLALRCPLATCDRYAVLVPVMPAKFRFWSGLRSDVKVFMSMPEH